MSARTGHTILASVLVLGAVSAPGFGCTETEVRHVSPVERGEEIVFSLDASPSTINVYSCSSCHLTSGTSSDIIPGANLGGVTRRPSYWGGAEPTLLGAINNCRSWFMGAVVPWKPTDQDALAVFAYLDTLPGDESPRPFTIQRAVVDVPAGDKTAGESVYTRACALCHGSAHTAGARLTDRAPLLPEQTIKDHATYPFDDQRLVFVEKVRHGGFLGYGGEMPPFSREVLSDEDLGALLAYLGLY